MTATHTWTIPTLKRRVSDDTITEIHWQLVSEEGGQTIRSYGSIPFTGTQDIPWASITESNAYDYFEGEYTLSKVTELQNAHQAKLDELNTPTETFGVPW